MSIQNYLPSLPNLKDAIRKDIHKEKSRIALQYFEKLKNKATEEEAKELTDEMRITSKAYEMSEAMVLDMFEKFVKGG